MERIKLENFRCFKDFTMMFKPGVNLLIGDNATGKTSLLQGVKIALSSFFTGFTDERTRFLGIASDDFLYNGYDGAVRPVQITFDSDGFFNQRLTRNGKNSKTVTSGIYEFKQFGKTKMAVLEANNEKRISLPLLASFSTEDIHSSRKLSIEQFRKKNLSPAFGYYECLQSDGLLPYWIRRLMVLNASEGPDNVEVRSVKLAARTVLGTSGCDIFSDLVIDSIRGLVYFQAKDGRLIMSDYLSDGFRRVVSLVVDLAFRCTILNKHLYGNEACMRTMGTVLIDEIDQHLHPFQQACLMRGLHVAFPQLQFIVTTHSTVAIDSVEVGGFGMACKMEYADGDYHYYPVRVKENNEEAQSVKLF